MKKTVIAIVGPTAVGKTSLSIEVAKHYNGEIISGDSMQVYRGLDIGTAKVTESEKQGIPHYMIDIKNPGESFTVADFQHHVQKYIDEITSHHKLPIMAGGSGLYVQAALFDYNFSNEMRNPDITKRLEKKLVDQGNMALYNRLKEIDPIQAEKVHPNNHRRLIRALEIYESTGLTMSEYQKKQQRESPYHLKLIGLEMDRELLYERINNRVDTMVADGLVDEVRRLYEQGLEGSQSMQAIGYKEFLPYFKGAYSLDRSIELLKQNSRRYAKRQYTWFRNKMNVDWYLVTPESINERFRIILDNLAGFLKDK